MKILVTGSKGFMGQNLIVELKNRGYHDIFEFDKETDINQLEVFCKECDFIYHLAGVNRPLDQNEFMEGNFGFTSILLDTLKKYDNKSPIMLSSSIQAELDNPYGISKKAGEELLFDYSETTGSKVLIYRFPNVFGKWSRPNYNSVIATFCFNVARDLPIQVNDSNVLLNLVYIDDVVDELINALNNEENMNGRYCEVSKSYQVKLGEIVDLIYSFKNSRETKFIANLEDEFTKKLYSTYLSFLPEDGFKYDLKMNIDHRGSFTEFIKTLNNGQVSINVSKPGITKGNHWHHTKNEKFLVVSGEALIRFRKIDTDRIIEYKVSGEKLEVLDIPVGYTHNIENIGLTDLVTVMWANELFDSKHPDTYAMEV